MNAKDNQTKPAKPGVRNITLVDKGAAQEGVTKTKTRNLAVSGGSAGTTGRAGS